MMLRCIEEMTLAKLGVLVKVMSFSLLAFSTNTWMAFLSKSTIQKEGLEIMLCNVFV